MPAGPAGAFSRGQQGRSAFFSDKPRDGLRRAGRANGLFRLFFFRGRGTDSTSGRRSTRRMEAHLPGVGDAGGFHSGLLFVLPGLSEDIFGGRIFGRVFFSPVPSGRTFREEEFRACPSSLQFPWRPFFGAGFSGAFSSPRSPPAELSGRRNFGPTLRLPGFPGGRFLEEGFSGAFPCHLSPLRGSLIFTKRKIQYKFNSQY